MSARIIAFGLLVAPLWASAAAQNAPASANICLAPSSVESTIGNTNEAIGAVRETFTTYLTGPSLGVAPLNARLESQVREEAKAAGCSYLLLTTLKHVRKTGGGGLLGRMAGSAVERGAWSAAGAGTSTAGRAATGAVAAAAGEAASNYAGSTKSKDELTLTSRLESATGTVLVEKTEKRKAQSDGEDLLTPLVEKASEAIAAAVAPHAR